MQATLKTLAVLIIAAVAYPCLVLAFRNWPLVSLVSVACAGLMLAEAVHQVVTRK